LTSFSQYRGQECVCVHTSTMYVRNTLETCANMR
jgi:hypothetical protein